MYMFYTHIHICTTFVYTCTRTLEGGKTIAHSYGCLRGVVRLRDRGGPVVVEVSDAFGIFAAPFPKPCRQLPI